MTRYVVIENTPGYLPEDDDPYTTDDLDDAKIVLRDAVERYCESSDELDKNDPWQVAEVYWSRELDFARVSHKGATVLDRVFEVMESEED